METTVLIQSAPKPDAAFPPSQWCYTYNLIKTGQLASEIFKFESVDDDGRTDDGPLVYYKLTLWAFGSGELKTNKMSLAPSEDSDQPGHLPSLIRVFTVRMKKHWVLSYPLRHCKDSAQTERMPRLVCIFAECTDRFVGFIMRQLMSDSLQFISGVILLLTLSWH